MALGRGRLHRVLSASSRRAIEGREINGNRELPFATTLRNLRYGLRRMLQSPGFTATAVLSLAVGIGANTAMFSLINSVIFNQRP